MKIVRINVPFTGIALDSVVRIYISDKEIEGFTVDDLAKARMVTEVVIQDPNSKEWIPSEFPMTSWKEQKEFLESGAFYLLVEDNIVNYIVVNTCKYCRESDQTVAAQGKFIDDPHA